MRRRVKVFIGLTVVDFVVAYIMGMDLPEVTVFLIITHLIGAQYADVVYKRGSG